MAVTLSCSQIPEALLQHNVMDTVCYTDSYKVKALVDNILGREQGGKEAVINQMLN